MTERNIRWGTLKDQLAAGMTSDWGTSGYRPFFYYGRDRSKPAADGVLISRVTEDRQGRSYYGSNGKMVFGAGMAGKFWAGPAVRHEEVRHSSDGNAIAVSWDPPTVNQAPAPQGHGKVIASRAVRESGQHYHPNAQLHPCRCGCKAMVRGLYKQGHDARHVSMLFRTIQAGHITREDADSVLAGSPRLITKLAGMLARAAK